MVGADQDGVETGGADAGEGEDYSEEGGCLDCVVGGGFCVVAEMRVSSYRLNWHLVP